MPKFIIRWNAGYGDTHEVVEAESEEKADEMAGDAWREEAESNADYGSEEYTDDLAEEYGLEIEDS